MREKYVLMKKLLNLQEERIKELESRAPHDNEWRLRFDEPRYYGRK